MELNQKNMSNWPYQVTKDDLIIDFYSGTGPGGQNRNKKMKSCRMKHLPTGIMSKCEDHRSKEQNKLTAFKRLSDKLVPLMVQAAQRETTIEICTDRIRTYHEPQQRVTDHRISDKKFNYSRILEGKDLIELINELNRRTNG